MQTRKLLIVIAILVAIILALVAALPGARQVLEDGYGLLVASLSWAFNLFMIGLVLGGPWTAGIGIYKLLQKFDENVDPNEDLNRWQTATLVLLMTVIVGLVWTILIYYAVANPGVAGLFSSFDHGFYGRFETPPVVWGLYGLLGALGMYTVIIIGKKLNF